MEIWHTADHHLMNMNIIEYCNRPYQDPLEMSEDLIDRWNSLVSSKDIVYYHGDFAMGKIAESLPMGNRLNGWRKYMIDWGGNHDRTFHKSGREKWKLKYEEAGFEFIGVDRSHYWNDIQIKLSHFPYYGDHTEEERFLDHRPIDDGSWLIHGHVHDLYRQRGRMINVGVDAWNGYPVNFKTIQSMIMAGENDLPAERITK